MNIKIPVKKSQIPVKKEFQLYLTFSYSSLLFVLSNICQQQQNHISLQESIIVQMEKFFLSAFISDAV